MEKYGSNHVSSVVYLAAREKDDRMVGIMDFRRRLNPYLLNYGGNIGYSVRPSERGKGNTAQMLRLVLPKCRAAEETRVLITCEADNIASRKTILRAGGKLENALETTERYWIDLKA